MEEKLRVEEIHVPKKVTDHVNFLYFATIDNGKYYFATEDATVLIVYDSNIKDWYAIYTINLDIQETVKKP